MDKIRIIIQHQQNVSKVFQLLILDDDYLLNDRSWVIDIKISSNPDIASIKANGNNPSWNFNRLQSFTFVYNHYQD
jgi:hypothetical protein